MRNKVLLATIIISGLMTMQLMASSKNKYTEDDNVPPKMGKMSSTELIVKQTQGQKKKANAQARADEESRQQMIAQQEALLAKLQQENTELAKRNAEVQDNLQTVQDQLAEDQEIIAAIVKKKHATDKEVLEATSQKEKLEAEGKELQNIVAEEQQKLAELAERKAQLERQIRESEASLERQRLAVSNMEDSLEAAQKQIGDDVANSNMPQESSQPAVGEGEGKKANAEESAVESKSVPKADTVAVAVDPNNSPKPNTGGSAVETKVVPTSLDKDLDAQSYPRPSSGGLLQWALETGKELAYQGANMAVNMTTRMLKSRDDRLAKGTCPLISVTELKDLFDKVWFHKLTLDQRNALTYASLHYNNQKLGQYKQILPVDPDEPVMFPPHFEADGGYFYFPLRFTCGVMRSTYRDAHKESKIVSDKTLTSEQKNKLRFEKYVKALQSPNEEEMLEQFDANFNEDPSALPYQWLSRMWPLFEQGPNYQFWRDLKYSGRSRHSNHTCTRIVIRATAFEPLVRVLEDGTQVKGSGEVLHFSIYGIRYRGKVTLENVRQLYDQFLETETDDWLVK